MVPSKFVYIETLVKLEWKKHNDKVLMTFCLTDTTVKSLWRKLSFGSLFQAKEP